MIGILLFLLFTEFHQVGYIPRGSQNAGRMLLGDTDCDGLLEIIFVRREDFYYKVLWFYEQEADTSFNFSVSDSVIIHNDTLDLYLWDMGDFDLDELYDLAFYYGRLPGPFWGICIYESPDSFSYPTQEVWRDTVGFALVTPICVYDIDQDDLAEIAKVCGYYTDLEIYEAVGNNTYEHIATVTTPSTHTASSTIAFGDFDSDNQNEFVWGYTGGEYSIWECTGNNSYQEILLQQLPTVNITDCFVVPDADGDGKLEFVVKGYVVPTARINAFIFEATDDNTYEIIKSFDLFGGHNSYYGGYSDVGDVDGDSIPEIALEACQNVYILKAAGNDSFYVWETLPGNNSGSSVRVFDLDSNGLSEIIISGNNETRIYEYEVGVAESIPSKIQAVDLSASPNPFREQTVIRYSVHETDHKMQIPTLKIYDASGRLVKSFYLESSIMNREAAISWNGKDSLGNGLPDGIYFLRLAVGDDNTTEKLLLIR